MLRAIAIALAISASALAKPTTIEDCNDLEVIRGGLWRAGPTYVGGQPTEETLKALASRGVRAVVSLRTSREMADQNNVPFDEAAVVRELGMDYINVGLGGAGTYSPDALARIHEFMARHDHQVLLHCTVGWRASNTWAALQTRYHDVPLSEALDMGAEMALGPQSIERLLGERIEWCLTGETLEPEKGWLVDRAWLEENIDESDVRILDVRPSYSKYFEAHAQGATHFDAHSLRGPRNGLPAQFRTNDDMAATLGAAGVSTSKRIVVYAEGDDILSATMTMFALEKLGHLNTSLLDGGVGAVRDASLTTQAYPETKAETFPSFTNPLCSATIEDVQKGIESRDILFVDARPADQYDGSKQIWSRNGHIPGAVNVHWKRLTTESDAHRMRSREELRSIFEAAGVTPDQDIVVYCGTGREATLLYMTLTRELGYPYVRLYEGGWTEYAAKEDLPVATN